MKEITAELAEAFFFEAMLNGYASGSKPEKNNPFPSWKTLGYRKGLLWLTDMWHTALNSRHSSGVTTIYWSSNPVWVMHYGGWYSDEVIPTLKAALRQSYKSKDFIGGRGPLMFALDNYIYRNMPSRSDFQSFEGYERISSVEIDAAVGFHWYRGEWLVEF